MRQIKTTIKNDEYGDPIVRVWDVYEQSWKEVAPEYVPDRVLASLSVAERQAILAAREKV